MMKTLATHKNNPMGAMIQSFETVEEEEEERDNDVWCRGKVFMVKIKKVYRDSVETCVVVCELKDDARQRLFLSLSQ